MNFNRVFHYKPSILEYHYFWKHLYKGNNQGFGHSPFRETLVSRCSNFFSITSRCCCKRPAGQGSGERMWDVGNFDRLGGCWGFLPPTKTEPQIDLVTNGHVETYIALNEHGRREISPYFNRRYIFK